MSEIYPTIGGGLRPRTDGKRAVGRMGVLARYAEEAGHPLHIVVRDEEAALENDFLHAAYVLHVRDDVVVAETLTQPVPVHSLRDLTGRMGKSRTHLLNEPEMRERGSKSRLPESCGDLMPATIVTGENFDASQLDLIPGDMVVIKPVSSLKSRKVAFVPKRYVKQVLPKYPTGAVIQEVLDTSQLPDTLQGLTDDDNRRLAAAKGALEIRLFAVHGQLVPLAKLARGRGRTMAKSDYAPLDPESVPESLYKAGQLVVARLQAASGINWLCAGIDFPWTPKREVEWPLLEVNLGIPAIPKEDKHPEASRRIRRELVSHLVSLAHHAATQDTAQEVSHD
jgi:hypothetical protein